MTTTRIEKIAAIWNDLEEHVNCYIKVGDAAWMDEEQFSKNDPPWAQKMSTQKRDKDELDKTTVELDIDAEEYATLVGKYHAGEPEPKNNDGRERCFWCGAPTRAVASGFAANYDICTECGK